MPDATSFLGKVLSDITSALSEEQPTYRSRAKYGPFSIFFQPMRLHLQIIFAEVVKTNVLAKTLFLHQRIKD